MANVKITELTDIGTPASDDVLEIVDISTNTSKKVQVSALGGGATPTLQEVTTEGNETTDDIIIRDGDWTLNLKKDIGLSPLVIMEHDVYGPKGIYTSQALQLNSVDELTIGCQIEILAERNNYFGIKTQSEDLVNTGNNLLTRLLFPTTSIIDQLSVERDFVFPDKAEGSYTLATTDDVGGATDLAYTPSPTNGIVTSSTGTDATLTLADATNAGLLQPADFTQLSTLATDLANKQATLTETNFGAFANGLTNKATPLDADLINIVDTADTNKQKKVTFTNVKAFLKTYFDTLYQAILTASNVHTFVDSLTSLTTPVDADRMIIVDNSASLAKKITWANIKATLKTYFDTLYATTAQVDLRTRELLQDFTDYTSTGVLTEQIISNQAITANDMKINSWLNFIATLSRTGTTNATVSIYVNTTSNSLSGAVKIATATITSTQSLPCFKRDYSINASSVLRGILFTANIVTDEIATQAQSTTTLTLSSAYYLITTVTLNNVADTVTQRAINLKSSK